jgi:hypothetical protein
MCACTQHGLGISPFSLFLGFNSSETIVRTVALLNIRLLGALLTFKAPPYQRAALECNEQPLQLLPSRRRSRKLHLQTDSYYDPF